MNVLQSRMVGFGSDETNLATSRSSRILLCPANTVSPFSVAFFGDVWKEASSLRAFSTESTSFETGGWKDSKKKVDAHSGKCTKVRVCR